MDKASIIKDAIEYIQELREQEKRIEAEISDLESGKINNRSTTTTNQSIGENGDKISTKRRTNRHISDAPSTFPIEVLDVSDLKLEIEIEIEFVGLFVEIRLKFVVS